MSRTASHLISQGGQISPARGEEWMNPMMRQNGPSNVLCPLMLDPMSRRIKWLYCPGPSSDFLAPYRGSLGRTKMPQLCSFETDRHQSSGRPTPEGRQRRQPPSTPKRSEIAKACEALVCFSSRMDASRSSDSPRLAPSTATDPLRVDVWSDIACPWCWVGKRHLERAIDALDRPAEVVWHAFELDPAAPVEDGGSIDYIERLARKYRVSSDEAQGMIDRMCATGVRVGLEFRFDRVRPTNTFDAHRLLTWARARGRQDLLKERLFRAYMTEGALLGDRGVLVEQARSVDLDPDEAADLLASGRLIEEVRADEAAAHRLGVRGVPFFVLGHRYAISGAQPPEVLAEALEALVEQKAGDEALQCGPEGCATGHG